MNNNLPAWITEKIERLTKEKAARENCLPADALNTLCGEAFTTIRGEMAGFPELARMLPSTLARNIRTGSVSALTAQELAAIVIADRDAQTASVIAGPDNLVEFTALKIRAFADLLGTEGGQSVR